LLLLILSPLALPLLRARNKLNFTTYRLQSLS
jgi:hypothetical protein